MDTIDKWLVGKTSITCIEPYPDRLFSRMTENDKNTTCVIRDFVQNVDLSMFEKLEQGDILFIDSSHVTKSGGDIPFEYFNILPRLKPGVIIHIHDIFSPFDYPQQWFGRGYNEAFVLRALLTDSIKYRILFFSDYMNKIHPEIYENDSRYADGGSIWIQKK